jgi:hypothetical protein
MMGGVIRALERMRITVQEIVEVELLRVRMGRCAIVMATVWTLHVIIQGGPPGTPISNAVYVRLNMLMMEMGHVFPINK